MSDPSTPADSHPVYVSPHPTTCPVSSDVLIDQLIEPNPSALLKLHDGEKHGTQKIKASWVRIIEHALGHFTLSCVLRYIYLMAPPLSNAYAETETRRERVGSRHAQWQPVIYPMGWYGISVTLSFSCMVSLFCLLSNKHTHLPIRSVRPMTCTPTRQFQSEPGFHRTSNRTPQQTRRGKTGRWRQTNICRQPCCLTSPKRSLHAKGVGIYALSIACNHRFRPVPSRPVQTNPNTRLLFSELD